MHAYDIQPDSPTLRIAPLEHDTDLDDFFTSMAEAIRTERPKAGGKFWSLPGIYVAEAESRTVGSEGETSRFFSEARQRYRMRGASHLRAEIKRVQWIAESVALVEVVWVYLGPLGREIGSECGTYVVRRNEGGSLRVHAAMLHGERSLFH